MLAVYPGSFDPITNGHLDVIRRGARLFDRMIVAVAINRGKQTGLFSIDERVELVQSVTADLENVTIDRFQGLTVDYVRACGAKVLLRGIRTISDFEYEYQMALTNRTFDRDVETVFVMSSVEYSYVSSKLIKEAALAGGDVSSFVPPLVKERLDAKLRHSGATD